MSEDRNPTPDPAENNAFFPSPYSLSQYTAPKTDFDGVIAQDAYKGPGKVLVIGTEERYMLMQNGKFFSTGNHPVESLLPMHHILEAGFDIEVATITGAPVKFEWWAFPQEDEAVTSAWNKLEKKMKSPKRLSDVIDNELGEKSEYVGVLIPGGHGAMLDLPVSDDVRSTAPPPSWPLAMAASRTRSPVTRCAFSPMTWIQAQISRSGTCPARCPGLLAKRSRRRASIL